VSFFIRNLCKTYVINERQLVVLSKREYISNLNGKKKIQKTNTFSCVLCQPGKFWTGGDWEAPLENWGGSLGSFGPNIAESKLEGEARDNWEAKGWKRTTKTSRQVSCSFPYYCKLVMYVKGKWLQQWLEEFGLVNYDISLPRRRRCFHNMTR